MLDREILVLARTLEDIDLLLSIQNLQAFVHTATDVLLRAVWDQLARFQSTLDAENHLLGILGVLGEVLVQQVQGVVVWCAVEFATIPEVGT